MLDLIVAMNSTGLIGINDTLPWRIPEDLAYFREKTMGKTIIMGRKTFASLPNQAPLPGRTNLVVTHDANLHNFAPEREANIIAEQYIKMEDVFSLDEQKQAFVIGGGEIYRELLPHCGRLFVTFVYKNTPVNDYDDVYVYFPLTISQLINEYNIEHESEVYVSKTNETKYQFFVFCGKKSDDK
jgi:dihydrofolate reductase